MIFNNLNERIRLRSYLFSLAQAALPPIVPGSQEESLVKGLKTMNISRISDHVQLLDWWAQMEEQMCANVADEKSRQMIESLTVEKDYSQRFF